MALELGVDSRLISEPEMGRLTDGISLAVDGLYYNVDATWDAGNTEYQYFLKGSEHFTDHEGGRGIYDGGVYRRVPYICRGLPTGGARRTG